jgi:hypothetical protein
LNMQLGYNVYYGSGAYRYAETGTAARYIQTAGEHQFYTAPSGTAGNPISFTQAMTLDASGNLLLGSTSSPGGIWSGARTFAYVKGSAVNNSGEVIVESNNGNQQFSLFASGGSAEFGMWSTKANSIVFGNNNTERARIDSSGWFRFTQGSSTAYIGDAGSISFGSSGQSCLRADGSALLFAVGGATERARIDSSGNLLVGTTSNGAGSRINVAASNPPNGYIATLSNSFGTTGRTGTYCLFDANNLAGWKIGVPSDVNAFAFYDVVAGTERARINSSGHLLIGTTSFAAGQNSKAIQPDAIFSSRSTTGGDGHILFYNPNGVVGQIYTSGSSTSYVTSSDYRLKEDIQPMTGALAKVAALKPCTYKWKADGSDGEGFIAHELQAVVPQCVTGEKDAVDAEGNPQYQGIDTSFLVATLTAAIQEQQAIITALTARIETLENK